MPGKDRRVPHDERKVSNTEAGKAGGKTVQTPANIHLGLHIKAFYRESQTQRVWFQEGSESQCEIRKKKKILRSKIKTTPKTQKRKNLEVQQGGQL